MLKLSKLTFILKEYAIRPAKTLGQNFLIDRNIREKIIDAISVNKEDVIFEIGAGLGSLTGELCKRAKKVVAIEKDSRLYEFLLQNCQFNNLELVHGDVLRYDFGAEGKVKVVGNLPYYISSPILTSLLGKRRFIDTIFVTVQKEFAERLLARPGQKAYGAISCFVQFYSEPSFLFTIKKTSFYPSPKVDSCFLKISIRNKAPYPVKESSGKPYLTGEEKLFKIIRASFGKRRKTILNALHSSGIYATKNGLLHVLESARIDPQRRPETLALQEFVTLSNMTGDYYDNNQRDS